jgi:SAM-dependent methyltransferase
MDDKDAQTLDFYAAEAQAYAERPREAEHRRIDRFVEDLSPGARILELGCGGGQDSAEMLARGFDVIPTDGSPELAAQAQKRLGRPVRVLLFDDLDEIGAYDGVWAHACLLHAPRPALPGIIDRIHAALKPSGVFYASFKAGVTEGRDDFGRYFNYLSQAELASAYGSQSRWESLTIDEDLGGGYDRKPTRWLHALAVKRA